MWIKKIKNRKLQYFIITMILLISSAILTACISFALETQSFIDTYYDAEECPIMFNIQRQGVEAEELLSSDLLSDKVSKIETMNAKMIESEITKGNEKLDCSSLILYGLDDREVPGYPLQMEDGTKTKAPADGDIWISSVFANAVGLEVGDQLSFTTGQKETYTISGIIHTPECSSGFLDNYIAYMNEETLAQVDSINLYGVQIYAKNNDVTIKEITDALPLEFQTATVYTIDQDVLKMCLRTLSTIFGAVGFVAAIIILGVSIVVIRYIVKATIAKEYRMIGIYKTLGRSSKEIVQIYLSSYMAAGMVGMFLGIFCARPLAVSLDETLIGKGFTFDNYTYYVGAAAMVIMIVVLALNLWMVLRKIGKITPLEALSTGMASSKEKMNRPVIRNAYHPLSMAINQCFRKRGMTILVIMILAVSFYMNVMAASVAWTLLHYEDKREVWENLPDYDGCIKLNGDVEALEYIRQSDKVRDCVAMDLGAMCSQMGFEGSDLNANSANPLVYENFTEDRYKGVPFTKGRICLNPHEIACSVEFLSKTDHKVGDYLVIDSDEKSIPFLITGSYSAMMKGGTSFYIQQKDFEELGFKSEMPNVLFWLKDGVSYKEFKQELVQKYPNVIVSKDFAFISKEGDTVASIAVPICTVIGAAFVAFSLLNIINLVYTQTRENRKKYGILKAMGFTSSYLKRECMIKLTLEAVAAMVIAGIFHEIISPVLFSLACGINFIMKPFWITAAVFGGMFLVLMIVTALMLSVIRKVSPVLLMEE